MKIANLKNGPFRLICFEFEEGESWFSSPQAQNLGGQYLKCALQAGNIRHIQHLRALINSFHETTQCGAWTQLNKSSEPLRKEVAHGFLPPNRSGNLRDQARTDG